MRPLKDRLAQLRGDRKPAATADIGDLTRRIERLRRAGKPPHQPDPVIDEAGLAEKIGANMPAPGVLLVEESIDGRGRHGGFPVFGLHHPLTGLADANRQCTGDWLFLDTETTGLSGGAGTVVFVVGLARFDGRTLELKQYLITRFGAEAAMLQCLAEQIRRSDALVSYNGKSFDLPLLASRFRLHGVENPFVDKPHFDLLHPVRRRFRKAWENCRLATVEQRLLGFERQQDLPGAEAPAAWLDFVKSGRYRPLRGVLKHNRLDLLSLAVLLPVLDRALAGPGPAGVDLVARRAGLRDRNQTRLKDLRLMLQRMDSTVGPVACR